MVDRMTILAGHPYFELVKPVISRQSWDKKWRVRWRDFHTVLQDQTFDSRQQAEAFASTLCKPPLTVDNDACDLADADRFWREWFENR